MATSPVDSRSSQYARSVFAIALTVALSVGAGFAGAVERSNYDALATSSLLPARSASSAGASQPVVGSPSHFNEQSGLPTFFTAPEGMAKRAGSLLLIKDVQGVARNYLRDLAGKYRMQPSEVDALELIDAQRLTNGAALVRFSNRIDGVEVFRERVGVLINADGSLSSVGGTLSGAGTREQRAKALQFDLDPEEALERMLTDMAVPFSAGSSLLSKSGQQGDYTSYQLAHIDPSGRILVEPARVKKVLFRTVGGLVPAYYGEVFAGDPGSQDSDGYSYVIAADSGKLLFRKNLTESGGPTQFNYRVYGETASPFKPYPGPAGRGGFPHPTGNPDGFQPTFLPNGNLISVVSAPFSMNDPWLPAGSVETVGNNADAFADRGGDDGYNPGPGPLPDYTADFRAFNTSFNTFDHAYDPALEPDAGPSQVQASITHLFYLNNWLHDDYYDAGFDEASGNAQTDNYGRGGVGGDSIRAEAQDFGGIDNANMATPADGGRPRMQMYPFGGLGGSSVEVSGALADTYASGVASGFGPQSFDLTSTLVQVDDGTDNGGAGSITDACEPLINAAAVSGRIAFVNRGNCDFTTKAQNVQIAGGIGMLLADVLPGAVAGMGGFSDSIMIPSLRITLADGDAIRVGLGMGTINAHLYRGFAVHRDGSLDSGIVAHEWGHYISNRLVQNASGLNSNQARSMGEGFGDFHALLTLVQEDDAMIANNANFGGVYSGSIYAVGGPSLPVSPNNTAYYGIRRYPYSTDMSRNPLTFKHIMRSEPLPAMPAPFRAYASQDNAEVHNAGEIWATALWECYVGLLNDTGRLTFDQARERMKLYLVGGYKLMPASPTFLEARDAILAMAKANDPLDFETCAAGFAKRGIGAGAVAPDRYSSDHAGVVESYGTGAAPVGAFRTLNASFASCDSDNALDNGEQAVLTMDIGNVGFATMSGATVTFSSPQGEVGLPAVPVVLENLEVGQPLVLAVPVRLNGAAGLIDLQIDAVIEHPDSSTAINLSRTFLANYDLIAVASADSDFEAPSLDWAVNSPLISAFTWKRRENAIREHTAFAVDIDVPGIQWMTSPELKVSAAGDFIMTFGARHSFEYDGTFWDGGVIEISANDGAWIDIGASVSPGYGGVLDDNNPMGGRPAFVDKNTSWPAMDIYTANLGNDYAGQTVKIRFGVATDTAVGNFGWEIDDVTFDGIDNTPFTTVVAESSVCVPDPNDVFGSGFER